MKKNKKPFECPLPIISAYCNVGNEPIKTDWVEIVMLLKAAKPNEKP